VVLPHLQAEDMTAPRALTTGSKATLDHGTPPRHDRYLRIPAEDRSRLSLRIATVDLAVGMVISREVHDALDVRACYYRYGRRICT